MLRFAHAGQGEPFPLLGKFLKLWQVELEAKSLANKAAVVYNCIPKLMKYAGNLKDWKKLYPQFKNTILGDINERLR